MPKGGRSQCVLCDEICNIPLGREDPTESSTSFCGKDQGHTICYLSGLTPSIPGPVGGPFGDKQMDREVGDEGLAGGVVWRSGEPRRPTGQRVGGLSTTSGPHPSQSQVEEPVGCLPLEPSPGPHMRRWWQIFVLCVFWMLLLWLVTPCLDLKTDSAPQEKWMDVAPRRCSCPWFKFRQCGCPSGSLNHSVCHHTAGEHQFDAGYEKMRGSLMGGAESTRPGAVLWWSVSGQHWGVPSHPPLGPGHLPLSVPNLCPWP